MATDAEKLTQLKSAVAGLNQIRYFDFDFRSVFDCLCDSDCCMFAVKMRKMDSSTSLLAI